MTLPAQPSASWFVALSSLIRRNHDFDAAVLGAAIGRRVVADGVTCAETLRGRFFRGNALAHQVVTHRLCAALRERVVVRGIAARIRVALHDNCLEALIEQRLCYLIQLF